MNRRTFLGLLGIVPAAASVPAVEAAPTSLRIVNHLDREAFMRAALQGNEQAADEIIRILAASRQSRAASKLE